MPLSVANAFANPAFQTQWQQGKAVTPNFWGPLAIDPISTVTMGPWQNCS
jgi:hypothetical protein